MTFDPKPYINVLFGVVLCVVVALLVGCATGSAEIIKTPDGVVVKGNAPGRTIVYKDKDVEVTVKDERMPNPLKSAINMAREFITGIFSRAQVAVGGD